MGGMVSNTLGGGSSQGGNYQSGGWGRILGQGGLFNAVNGIFGNNRGNPPPPDLGQSSPWFNQQLSGDERYRMFQNTPGSGFNSITNDLKPWEMGRGQGMSAQDSFLDWANKQPYSSQAPAQQPMRPPTSPGRWNVGGIVGAMPIATLRPGGSPFESLEYSHSMNRPSMSDGASMPINTTPDPRYDTSQMMAQQLRQPGWSSIKFNQGAA